MSVASQGGTLGQLNVLITGASSGIGEAVAQRFRASGARIFLTGRRVEAPSGVGKAERYLPGDLGNEDFVRVLLREAVAELGVLDTIVVCHGLQGDGALTEMTPERASHLMEVNVLSVFTLLRHSVLAIRESGGQIVVVSSRFGVAGIANQAAYSAAKGGLIMLGKSAALELAPKNIRVNIAAPGLTETPTIEAGIQRRPDPEGYRRSRASTIPMRRLAQPAEVAEAIFFLGSPASSYITGAVLPIDGGYTAA